MKNSHRWVLVAAMALAASAQAPAAEVSLAEFAFNIDGSVTNGSAPGGVSLGGFNTMTGLGIVTIQLSGAGSRHVGMFADHEIDEVTNTFYNEYGAASGSPAAGQSWEIDEPGWTYGNIYDNFKAGVLDGTNGVPSSAPDDVSMAMAWAFTLDAGQTATISFRYSDIAPTGGFFLSQFDPDSNATIYMSSGLSIQTGGQVPEPASFALVGLALLGLWQTQRRGAGRR